MKVIIEVEKNEELQGLERFLRLLDPTVIRINSGENIQRIQDFVRFVDTTATSVDKIIIPNREERHAR